MDSENFALYFRVFELFWQALNFQKKQTNRSAIFIISDWNLIIWDGWNNAKDKQLPDKLYKMYTVPLVTYFWEP